MEELMKEEKEGVKAAEQEKPKKRRNRKIQAPMVAMDASENILFLQMFLTPCLML